MVKTPRPPFIGTKTPKRGHEGRIIGTKRAKRGHENEGQSLNAARRMVGAGRVFCPPRVQCSPPARKPETAAPPRVFVWPRFGRISKIQKFNRLRRNKTTFAPVFGRFWRVFGRVLDVFGQRAKECSRAAETARRVCQLSNTKRPALFLLWRHTRRAFDMDETGAGLLCTFWQRFSYQKVNQTCTTWLQILYQIRRTEEGKARRAAFLVV